jgi:hypothetical protein
MTEIIHYLLICGIWKRYTGYNHGTTSSVGKIHSFGNFASTNCKENSSVKGGIFDLAVISIEGLIEFIF